MMSYRTISYAVDANVATIALNVPQRKNAIGVEMANELVCAVDEAHEDAAVHVIVLTATGTVFCAGGDLSSMPTAAGTSQPIPMRGDFGDLLVRLARIEKPTVARVQGPAMGGGLGLIASCDIAIACESATFATPEIKRGFFPFMISAPLARVMPRRKLMEMILLGEKLNAQQALECGLVTRVVADAKLDESVNEIVRTLAAHSPTALRMGLSALRAHSEKPLDQAIPHLRDGLVAALSTDDAREGMAAFLEKRAPKWSGR